MDTNTSNLLNEVAEISQRIKSKKPPATTSLQKQAAIIMAPITGTPDIYNFAL